MPKHSPTAVVHCPAWKTLPGLVHGTTTRAALPQLGKIHVFERLRDLRKAGIIPEWPTVSGDQTHEDRIMIVHRRHATDRHGQPVGFQVAKEDAAVEYDRTDALFTQERGVLLCLRTADCLPVFLLDRRHHAIGLAHCGWRGVRQDLAGKLASVFLEHESQAEDLEAWLGPCISVDNYEVGEALLGEFAAAFPGAPISPDGRRLDLRAITAWQLHNLGVPRNNIHHSPDCTYAQTELYHSYRRDGEKAGRLLSFLALKP